MPRERTRVVALAFAALALGGCAGHRARRPTATATAPFSAGTSSPSSIRAPCHAHDGPCVDPHGSPAGLLATHASPRAWAQAVRGSAARGEWRTPVALAGGAVLARALDDRIERGIVGALDRTPAIGDAGAYGLVGASLGLGLLRPAHGRTARDETWTQAEAFALTFAVTTGVKALVARERPDHDDRASFPSGHTAIAFCAATLIHRNAGPALGIPAYAVATLTGFSRVESERHFASDVLAGAAIGVAIATLVDALHFGDGACGHGICGRGVTLEAGPTADGRPGVFLCAEW